MGDATQDASSNSRVGCRLDLDGGLGLGHGHCTPFCGKVNDDIGGARAVPGFFRLPLAADGQSLFPLRKATPWIGRLSLSVVLFHRGTVFAVYY